MTRKQYNNLIDKGLGIPFSLPNFKQVIKCSLTIVVYERPLWKKYARTEIKEINIYNDIYLNKKKYKI